MYFVSLDSLKSAFINLLHVDSGINISIYASVVDGVSEEILSLKNLYTGLDMESGASLLFPAHNIIRRYLRDHKAHFATISIHISDSDGNASQGTIRVKNSPFGINAIYSSDGIIRFAVIPRGEINCLSSSILTKSWPVNVPCPISGLYAVPSKIYAAAFICTNQGEQFSQEVIIKQISAADIAAAGGIFNFSFNLDLSIFGADFAESAAKSALQGSTVKVSVFDERSQFSIFYDAPDLAQFRSIKLDFLNQYFRQDTLYSDSEIEFSVDTQQEFAMVNNMPLPASEKSTSSLSFEYHTDMISALALRNIEILAPATLHVYSGSGFIPILGYIEKIEASTKGFHESASVKFDFRPLDHNILSSPQISSRFTSHFTKHHF